MRDVLRPGASAVVRHQVIALPLEDGTLRYTHLSVSGNSVDCTYVKISSIIAEHSRDGQLESK